MTVNVGDLTHGVRHQRRHQSLGGSNPLQLSQKLTQRRAVIAPAKQRLKRMLVGIESGQGRDPQQGGKKQGLKAPPQRLLAVMQQREVIVGLGALMGLDGLSELGHNRAKGIVLIEPMGKEMHANTRQMGCDLDHRSASTHRTDQGCVAGAAFDMGQGANWATIVDIGGRYAGTATGFINMVGNAGNYLQPVVGAIIFNHFGWNVLLAVYAAAFVLAGNMWWFIDPNRTFYEDTHGKPTTDV